MHFQGFITKYSNLGFNLGLTFINILTMSHINLGNEMHFGTLITSLKVILMIKCN